MDIRVPVFSVAASVLALAVVTGCEGPSPVESARLETAPTMSRLSARDALPFRLSGGAALAFQRFAPGFPAERSDFDGRCSTPADFLIGFSVVAEAVHLGRLTGEFEHCSRIDFQTGASTLADGLATMTAANGDELEVVYRTADEPEGEFDEHFVFDGGTGRFEHARGEALAMTLCDRATGTCELEARGTLIYDASERARR